MIIKPQRRHQSISTAWAHQYVIPSMAGSRTYVSPAYYDSRQPVTALAVRNCVLIASLGWICPDGRSSSKQIHRSAGSTSVILYLTVSCTAYLRAARAAMALSSPSSFFHRSTRALVSNSIHDREGYVRRSTCKPGSVKEIWDVRCLKEA